MFFVPFCLVSCGAFVTSLYYPRTYRATTSFEVRNDPVMVNLHMTAGVASYKYFRKTMRLDMTSVETMSEVVDDLGLMDDAERDPDGTLTPDSIRRRSALARSLGATLTISTKSPSDLIDIVTIAYTGPDPTIGRKLVDQAKKTYIRRTMKWIHDYLVRQRDYFRREADEATDEVLAAKREETRLRLENPHVDPTDPGAISVKLAGLESERRDLLLRKREYEAELDAQRQLLAVNDPKALGLTGECDGENGDEFISATTLAIAAQIRHLDDEVDKLRVTRGMTDEHPEIKESLVDRERLVVRLQQQRSADRRAVADGTIHLTRPSAVPAPGTPESIWQGERARVGVQITAQTAKIREVDISLQTNDLAIGQLRKARDEVYQKQEEFSFVMERVTKAGYRKGQVEQTLGQIEPAIKAVEQNRLVQFSEGQPARGGSLPISPKATTVVLLALISGIGVGVLFVILAEVLDHVYRSSGQVARSLGLPLLEAIDEIVTPKDRRRMLVYNAVLMPILVVFCLGLTGLTGSMAYLSITQPWTYEKIRSIPHAALELFIEEPTVEHAETPADDG